MYQKVILVGNLGRDPQMRHTPAGQQVTDFSMATSEKWTGQDGQMQERTTWWKVTTWGKLAENCNQYLKKGSKVLVEGRMNPDPKTGGPKIWTGTDQAAHASYELTALTVKFLSSRAESGGAAPAETQASAEVEAGEEDIPF